MFSSNLVTKGKGGYLLLHKPKNMWSKKIVIEFIWIWSRINSSWIHDYESEKPRNSVTMNLKTPWIPWPWIWKRHEFRDYECKTGMNSVNMNLKTPWIRSYELLKSMNLKNILPWPMNSKLWKFGGQRTKVPVTNFKLPVTTFFRIDREISNLPVTDFFGKNDREIFELARDKFR